MKGNDDNKLDMKLMGFGEFGDTESTLRSLESMARTLKKMYCNGTKQETREIDLTNTKPNELGYEEYWTRYTRSGDWDKDWNEN